MSGPSALNIHSVYAYLILDFTNPDRLGRIDGDFLAYVIFDVSYLVPSLRAGYASHRRYLRVFVQLRSNVSSLGGFTLVSRVLDNKPFS